MPYRCNAFRDRERRLRNYVLQRAFGDRTADKILMSFIKSGIQNCHLDAGPAEVTFDSPDSLQSPGVAGLVKGGPGDKPFCPLFAQ